MLSGLGSDKRSQAEPSPLLLETLTLALCPQPCAQTLTAGWLVLWVGGTGRGLERDETAEQEEKKEKKREREKYG